MIATSAMAEGDNREVALDHLLENGICIIRASKREEWPGSASVTYSPLWIAKQEWHGSTVLDGVSVDGISAYLTPQTTVVGNPHRLISNARLAFTGSQVQGKGFVLTEDDAKDIIASDPKYRAVLFPFLSGEDHNSRPDQSPSRWVINFFDWPLDRASSPIGYNGPVATDYPLCLDILRTRVKPERDKYRGRNNTADKRADFWWQYGAASPGLYAAIANMNEVIFHSFTSKYVAFGVVKTGVVFSAPHVVFAFSGQSQFAVLQSTIHEVWVRQYTSYSLSLARYTPSDCFDTFPFPVGIALSGGHEESLRDSACQMRVAELGGEYLQHRSKVMLETDAGLVDIYNRFHDPDDTSANIQMLRELHVEMDKAVAAAYGWAVIELGHGFHETKQGTRFTISESARREVLARLLKLNHERHEEETRQVPQAKTKGSRGRKTQKTDSGNLPLLGTEGA